MNALTAESGSGKVTFDGSFVTIRHKNVFGRVHPDEQRLPVTSIAAVRLRLPTFTVGGAIRFVIAADNPKSKAYEVAFGKSETAQFEALRQAVEAAVTQTPGSALDGAAPAEDVILLLERLGRLRDSGVVTPEEFEAKKTELLGRL